jgi:hypothetical protein
MRRKRASAEGDILFQRGFNYDIFLDYCSNNHEKNFSTSTASIFIGIEECKTPQISEHCP